MGHFICEKFKPDLCCQSRCSLPSGSQPFNIPFRHGQHPLLDSAVASITGMGSVLLSISNVPFSHDEHIVQGLCRLSGMCNIPSGLGQHSFQKWVIVSSHQPGVTFRHGQHHPGLTTSSMGLGNSTLGFFSHPGMDNSKPCVLSQTWATVSSQAREKKICQSTHSRTATVSAESHEEKTSKNSNDQSEVSPRSQSTHPGIATVSQESHLTASQHIQEQQRSVRSLISQPVNTPRNSNGQSYLTASQHIHDTSTGGSVINLPTGSGSGSMNSELLISIRFRLRLRILTNYQRF